jgi:acetyl esterase
MIHAPDELDPDARRFLDLVAESGRPPLYALSVAAAREAVKAGNPSLSLPGPELAKVDDIEVPGADGPLPARRYIPEQAKTPPLLIFFHGGGFVYCDLDTHDGLCRSLAKASGCMIVSVGYRLAPEYPFPAPVNDAATAACWLKDQAFALGADPSRIAVGGDSAGGTLAAILAQTTPGFAAQLLLYPLLDFTFAHASIATRGEGFGLTRAGLEWFRDHYVAKETDWRNPSASPGLCRSLHGLPPAYVLTAGFDPLKDEADAYVRRLRQAGIFVSVTNFPGQIHGFAMMDRVMSAADAAVDDAAAWLKDVLRTGGQIAT